MNYMLDSCAFIWYIETSDRLPEEIRELIDTEEHMYVSIATFWEIAIKQSTGKLDLEITMSELEAKCAENKIAILPLELPYFERIKKLPLIHRDPFDRVIIATAIEEKLTLITNDGKIAQYEEVKTLWQTTKED
ncbi:MAG: type II toxin-antitoxin system VapC family toxin [Synergistaceae bacterium]|nr:type II toxin-antitoxin system VapC family toxin [Synergistaceae bacterium]